MNWHNVIDKLHEEAEAHRLLSKKEEHMQVVLMRTVVFHILTSVATALNEGLKQ
jgi:hypothetical protein